MFSFPGIDPLVEWNIFENNLDNENTAIVDGM